MATPANAPFASGIELRHTTHVTNAQATLRHKGGLLEIAFTLPKNVIRNILGAAIYNIEDFEKVVGDNVKCVVKTDLKLSYSNDIETLAAIRLYGYAVKPANAPDANWYVNDTEYSGSSDSLSRVFQVILEHSFIEFTFDEQSLSRLAIWLDYIYENHIPWSDQFVGNGAVNASIFTNYDGKSKNIDTPASITVQKRGREGYIAVQVSFSLPNAVLLHDDMQGDTKFTYNTLRHVDYTNDIGNLSNIVLYKGVLNPYILADRLSNIVRRYYNESDTSPVTKYDYIDGSATWSIYGPYARPCYLYPLGQIVFTIDETSKQALRPWLEQLYENIDQSGS
jgi:hypothetical protein